MSQPLQIGLLLFPNLTQLDLTGPLQVFSRIPGAVVHLIAKRIEPVQSDTPLALLPTVTVADCPPLDVICVPGGRGTDALLDDDETLDFLRRQAAGARYVTSVCTGSLVLGAAGLLRGYRAATHWSAMSDLAAFGAVATPSRVCVDRNRITGGGVTAGIDFALTLAAILTSREIAEMIQLVLEYNPAPPFDAGSPERAPPAVLKMLAERMGAARQRREDAVRRAAARLDAEASASSLAGRRPGLVVAGGFGPAAAGKRRPRRPIGAGRAGQIRLMRLFPFARGVGFVRRRHVDGMVQPAVPGGGHRGRLGIAIVQHPSPLEAERRVDLAALGADIAVADFVGPD
jgi:cyclohexyl-isocyanide hydratase